MILINIIFFSLFYISTLWVTDSEKQGWLVNNPPDFKDSNNLLGKLVDVHDNTKNMSFFSEFSDYFLVRTDAFTDGEVVDALEHYFWGKTQGLAMELGALDGASYSRSMTVEYEKSFGWKRILIEGFILLIFTFLTYIHLFQGILLIKIV